MKRYVFGLCFVVSNLTHAAAEQGPCYQLADRLEREAYQSVHNLCFPCTARMNDGAGELVIAHKSIFGLFEYTSCKEASRLLLWRISNNLNAEGERRKAYDRVEKLERCLERYPKERKDPAVMSRLESLRTPKTLPWAADELEKCKAGDTAPLYDGYDG